MRETTDVRLLPCPFCGGVSSLTETEQDDSCRAPRPHRVYAIECNSCEVRKEVMSDDWWSGSTPPPETEADREARAEAIAAWNRRAALEPAPKPAGETVNELFANCDEWGAAEWFDRLAKAIHAQDAAVVAGNDLRFATHKNIAASSAMRLVREFEPQVRSALAAAPIPPSADSAQDVGGLEYEVRCNDEFAASSTSLADAMHYAAVYGQDGPTEIFEVRRRKMDEVAAYKRSTTDGKS